MAANLIKHFSRRFRRNPFVCSFLIIILCLLYLLCLLPSPGPYIQFTNEYSNHSADSYEILVSSTGNEDQTLMKPVFREGVRGNFEPTRKLHTAFNRPGDHGVAYSVEVKSSEGGESGKSEYGMNMAASSLIPMDRIVPDIRHSECQYWHYPESLPTATVVIVFHNEGFSTLLRTVHSVLLRSPQRFLREVLLVDDYSDKAPLREQLEKYIAEHFGTFKHDLNLASKSRESLQGERLNERSGKVRLVRNSARSGLIRSRSRGAHEALGDVVVFLDAHCEVNTNWLVPLLAPIAANPRTLSAPIVDGIDWDTFEYRPVYDSSQHFMGIWEWGMLYKEIAIDMDEHLKTHRFSEPYLAATHAGGLFAIGKKFFLELGGYDEGLLVWGGENFELSFKVWQCGGRQVWCPCSRVGHIYRPFMPYNFGNMISQRKGPLVLTNYKRVIEVWFDEQYKKYFYTREPLAIYYDPGNITAQLQLKERLHCKSFDWFISRAPGSNVLKDFPRLPPNVAWGEVHSSHKPGQCLDSPGAHPPSAIRLNHCYGTGTNQLFRLNEKGQLGFGERCIDGNTGGLKVGAVYYVSWLSLLKLLCFYFQVTYCKLGTVNGPWSYMNATKQILYRGNHCLTVKGNRVLLANCNDQLPATQQWTWQIIKPNE